jgi:hypothetical protein
MLSRFRRPSHGTIAAYAALFIALGGTSYAAVAIPRNSVGSSQIRTHSIRNVDLASNSVSTSKVRDGSLRASDFRSGDLPAGATGPQGPAGVPGTARVYGRIAANGEVDLPRSKNVGVVTKPFTGIYCITPTGGTGIDVNTTGVVVTPDPRGEFFTDQDADAEWDSLGRDCPSGAVEIKIFVNGGNNATLDSNGDTYQRYAHGFADGPFFFIIP